MRNTVEAAVHA